MAKFLKKFGSHYAIERFSLLFLSLVLCMSVLVSTILARKIQTERQVLNGSAVYTRSFVMSQTKNVGYVRNVYTNEAHTRVVILMKFDNILRMRLDASDYMMFLAGSDMNQGYTKIKSHPTGMIYVLGSTGYVAVYLQDLNGFPNQMLQLYFRANVNLTGTTASGYEDTTFNDYNQGLIYFNPGGSFAARASFLERSDWTVSDMLNEVMIRSDEVSLRSALRNDLVKMETLQRQAAGHIETLESLGVKAPAVPPHIDDQIYALANDGSLTERLHYITAYGGGWVTPDNSRGLRDDQVTVFLDSDYIVPGGFDIEWQTSNVQRGYLESLTGSTDLNYWSRYLSDVNRNPDTLGITLADYMNSIDWQYADGTHFTYTGLGTTQRDLDIKNTIDLLFKCWTAQYDWKIRYETIDLPALLQLDMNSKGALQEYSVNTGETQPVLVLW